MTIVIITDTETIRYKIAFGKAHKYYYSYYYKNFTKTLADKERHIFKKKNKEYFSKAYVFNKKFWKRYLLWNKGTIDDSIYDIFIRFNIKVTKL